MTILHISTTDNRGGSGRAAYRIHTGIRVRGIRSRMLVGSRATEDSDVALLRSVPLRLVDRAIGKTLDHFGYQYLGYPSTFLLPLHPWFREADVVQLYNTHGGYFNHLAFPILSRRKPIVWRLSDLWPMTGHCPFDEHCGDMRFGGHCPNITTYPAIPRDTSNVLWRAKQWAYERSWLTIVAPTRWMARMARESPLLGRFPVHVIPNGVDTDIFHPMPQSEARRILGISVDQPVICFGANDLNEPRKGARVLTAALARLASRFPQPATVLTIGSGGEDWCAPAPFVVHPLGHLSDDTTLVQAYVAADVFIAPALADQLPNTILESMACGTPVAAFIVGGIPEAVHHLHDGYLAPPRDAAALATGVVRILADHPLRQRLGMHARDTVVHAYDMGNQITRYIDLYKSLAFCNLKC